MLILSKWKSQKFFFRIYKWIDWVVIITIENPDLNHKNLDFLELDGVSSIFTSMTKIKR